MIDTFALRHDQAHVLKRSFRRSGPAGTRHRQGRRGAVLAGFAVASGIAVGLLVPLRATASEGVSAPVLADEGASPGQSNAARLAVTVQLEAPEGSTVTGTATFVAAGDEAHAPQLDDATRVTFEVSGLPAGATARALLHAGSPAQPSASAALLPALTADDTGSAVAGGFVLFRGTESVAFSAVADGEHAVSILLEGQVVAYGVIPALTAE